jgi:hypothetical protein
MNESIHGERTASELQDRVTELIEQQTAISEVLRAIGPESTCHLLFQKNAAHSPGLRSPSCRRCSG